MIGRRFAFNVSLFTCSIFAICAGASPNWYVLGTFTALAAFGSGGNLILDTTVFLEFLPGDKQWLLTLMACWWGFAPVIAASFAWPFLSISRYYCKDAATCTYHNNMVSLSNCAEGSFAHPLRAGAMSGMRTACLFLFSAFSE